jgi:cell cycle checkpoint control protein RAD9A
MAIISLTLSEEGMGIFHDALGCISKFAEEVCLEARKDKVRDLVVLSTHKLA